MTPGARTRFPFAAGVCPLDATMPWCRAPIPSKGKQRFGALSSVEQSIELTTAVVPWTQSAGALVYVVVSWVFPSCRLDPSFGVRDRQPFPGCRALSSADCAPWNKINVGFTVRFCPLAGLHPLASCISSGLACELPLPTWDDQEERSEICAVQSVYAGVDDLACHRRGRSQGRW